MAEKKDQFYPKRRFVVKLPMEMGIEVKEDEVNMTGLVLNETNKTNTTQT